MGSVFQDNTFIDVSQLKRFRKKTHESTFSFLSTYWIIGYNFAKANYIYIRSPKNNSSPKNEILKTFFFFVIDFSIHLQKHIISQSFWVPQNKESHTVSEQHKSGLHFWVNYTMTNIFLSGHFADLDQSPNTWQLIWCQIMQKYLPFFSSFCWFGPEFRLSYRQEMFYSHSDLPFYRQLQMARQHYWNCKSHKRGCAIPFSEGCWTEAFS